MTIDAQGNIAAAEPDKGTAGKMLNLQRELGLQGRRWVLVDDTPFEHHRTRRKLDICGSRDRRRFVWISPFTGNRRDITLSALPPLVALSLAVQPSPARRGR